MNEDIFYINELSEIRGFCLNSDKEDIYKYIYSLQQENQLLKEDYNKVVHEATEFESKVYELQDRIEKAGKFCKKQKQKMYKNRNKIAVFILSKIQELLKGDVIND